MPDQATLRIRDLNDRFRAYLNNVGGRFGALLYVTSGVAALGENFVAHAIQAACTFDAFTPDNDPWGEHDFGAFDLEGEHLFWKIEYLDRDLQFGSEDPADSESTTRVLTVMLAAEY